jgi:hypothetical protein
LLRQGIAEGTTMGNARTSVISGNRARVSSCPSFRARLTGTGAVASAGILVLGLLTASPDVRGAENEVAAVRLAAAARFQAAPSTVLLDLVDRGQVRAVVPITAVVDADRDGTPSSGRASAAGVTNSVALPSPALADQSNAAAALTATAAAPILGALLQPLLSNPIIGPIIGVTLLFGPIILLVVLACPPCAVFNVVSGLIQSIIIDLTPVPALATVSAAMVEAQPAIDPASTSGAPPSDSAPVAIAIAGPADAARTAETGEMNSSPTVGTTDPLAETEKLTSTEPTTELEQVPADEATAERDVTEPAEADNTLARPTAASAPEPAAAAPSSEPADSTERAETPRPVHRNSLGAGEKPRVALQHRHGDRSIGPAGAADEGSSGSLSVASSPAGPTGRDRSGDGSSVGDSSSAPNDSE